MSPQEPAPLANPIPKGYRHGTDRACDPEQTFRRVSAHFRAMGITRIADVTGLDRVGIPVCVAVRPASHSLAASQGKGMTLWEAKVSAVMETIENYHAETVELPVVKASYNGLRDGRRVLDPYDFWLRRDSLYHADLPIEWVAGRDIARGEEILVPYDLVHTSFLRHETQKVECFATDSSGLASGNNPTEAFNNALCELVERDALARAAEAEPQNAVGRSIDVKTIEDPLCLELIEKLRQADLEVYLEDVTSPLGIAVIQCLILDKQIEDVGTNLFNYGFGAHLSPVIAAIRAITEAAQSRLTIVAGTRDDILRRRYDRYRNIQYIKDQRRLRSGISPTADFRRMPNLATDRIDGDLAVTLDRLARGGFKTAIMVDLTKERFGIAVVRGVVPGLLPHPENDYAVMGRALSPGNGA